MTKSRDQQDLLTMLAKNESLISELYDIYGQQFKNKDFWINLSTEEKLHFEWIKSFYKYAKEFQIAIDDYRLKTSHVEESINRVKRLIFQAPDATLEQAFKNALLLEADLVEQNYFSIFKSTRSNIASVLKQLELDTHKHIAKIKKEKEKCL